MTAWPRALAAMGLLLAAALCTAAEPAAYLQDFPRAGAVIETRQACHIIDLYLAVTPQQRAQGLMHIRKLDEYEGMLFSSEQPARVSMWMKNTYLPLDMLFIKADGKIAYIAHETTPLSEATIGPPVPVNHVLELNGGFTARHQVSTGDRLVLLKAAP